MSKTLPDKEIKNLIGSVILGANADLINPNGIQLRLGESVLFHSTNEEKKLKAGHFLKVSPGESLIFSSLEKLDFSKATVQAHYPNCALMALITPTTTMMREGIAQVSSKIDPGFKGVLNWSLRNCASKDLTLQHAEPIFKLTFMLLSEAEHPESLYGDRKNDAYQHTSGIARSNRRLPTDIPKEKLIQSSFEKLDPRKRLEEAGYPFNHIGRELIELHGSFETVSKDVLLLKDQFNKMSDKLSEKIDEESNRLKESIQDLKAYLTERIDYVFSNRFNKSLGILIAAISLLLSLYLFIDAYSITQKQTAGILLLVAVIIALGTFYFYRKSNH